MSSGGSNIIRLLVLSYGARSGKTSLIKRFVEDEYDHEYTETMGNIFSKQFTVDGEFMCLQILDTPGDPTFANVGVESMKFADAFMIVYDLNEPSALQSSVALRFSIIQEKQLMNPPMILVGAKSDLMRGPTKKFAASMIARTWECPFVETSARENVNVTEAFVQLIRQHKSQRRTLVHESRSSSILSNVFPRLRAWASTESFGRVMKRGWLQKRGFVMTNWKRRHVVIYDDGSLQYFRDDKSDGQHPLGEIDLRDVWQITEYREDGHEDAFMLQTPDRDWYFSCANESDKQGWLDEIVRLIADFAAQKTSSSTKGMALSRRISSTMPSESDRFFGEKTLSLSDKESN